MNACVLNLHHVTSQLMVVPPVCSFNRGAPSDDASVSTSFGGASLIDASSGVVSTGTSLIGDNASEIWCCKSLLEEFSWFSSTALGVID